jgi:hypothetical protein
VLLAGKFAWNSFSTMGSAIFAAQAKLVCFAYERSYLTQPESPNPLPPNSECLCVKLESLSSGLG